MLDTLEEDKHCIMLWKWLNKLLNYVQCTCIFIFMSAFVMRFCVCNYYKFKFAQGISVCIYSFLSKPSVTFIPHSSWGVASKVISTGSMKFLSVLCHYQTSKPKLESCIHLLKFQSYLWFDSSTAHYSDFFGVCRVYFLIYFI